MAQYERGQLRSFIAPAAPATRAPCDGTESDLRIEFGFTPRWYHRRLGIDFSERWHLDPVLRRDTIVRMRQELNRHFPSLELGGPDPESAVGTLNGVHGGVLMARSFGIPAEYYVDNWPAALHAYLAPETIAKLEPLALEKTPLFEQLWDQMRVMEQEWGRIEGYLNWQGVLNNAFRIRGNDIFLDLMMDPGLAHHLFEVITETMIAGMKMVYARQAATGVHVRHATLSNCVVNMLSPDQYAEHVLPYDRRISEAFDFFGIHNCAWSVDGYVEHYASIGKLGYVDMGMNSDLATAKRYCPNARRAIMYTPTDLLTKTLDELRADLERAYRDLAPCDIVMADIDDETPDERVLAFAKLADDIMAGEAPAK